MEGRRSVNTALNQMGRVALLTAYNNLLFRLAASPIMLMDIDRLATLCRARHYGPQSDLAINTVSGSAGSLVST
jgi:hypothetical protein